MLEMLVDWLKQGRRSINIKMDTIEGHVNKFIFVYDFETGEGTYINDLSELHDVDFEQMKRDSELKTLKMLQAKYM